MGPLRGINRNILECKGASITVVNANTSCINRNILECKEDFEGTYTDADLVLIETYWNVKGGKLHIKETGKNRINRNILECKVESQGLAWWRKFCINRNILECKVDKWCLGNAAMEY